LETGGEQGYLSPREGWTELFIYPGYEFKIVDALITNFHMPRSSLLLLVAAFVGKEILISAYKEAVREGYRFLSYGDAMFII
jgi:S-adenosylmethionine:tRNA ribosyltransferase-isomerase